MPNIQNIVSHCSLQNFNFFGVRQTRSTKNNSNVPDVASIDIKLKKYNKLLSQNLKTLEYVYMIETKLLEGDKKHRKDISELKLNVQQEILRISKKIKHFQSMKSLTTTLV